MLLHQLISKGLNRGNEMLGEYAYEWQPIYTAPRDGTNILVYEHTKDWTGCEAKIFAVAYWNLAGSGGWDIAFCGGYEFDQELNEPTHWMPLPAPPKEAK